MRFRPTAIRPGSLASWIAISVVLVVGSAYLAFGVAKVDWLKDYTRASMTIPDSVGLMPRSPVLLSGIRVGQVTSVRNTGHGVLVEFRIEDTYRVPVTSAVRIETLSALGEPYIEFTPTVAGGPYLRDGQAVDTRRVRTPTSLPDFARTMTELLEQLHPETMKALVSTMAQGLSGVDTMIPPLARSTSLLTSTLLARTDLIRRMLDDLQAHAADMWWVESAMTDAAGPWGAFGPKLNDVAAGVAEVIRVGKMPDDYTTGTGLIPFLHEVTAYLETAGPELRQLIPVLTPLASTAAGSLHSIDLSSLITQALNSTTSDGALRLQLTVK